MTGRHRTEELQGDLLRVRNLAVSFRAEEGRVAAVREVSFSVQPGEVLAVVGESGSGKSATALAVMGLLPPSARVTGSVRIRGEEMIGLSDAELSKIRGRRMSMVFQDPLTALTPVYSIGDQIAEAVRIHGGKSLTARAAEAHAIKLLEVVGIADAARRARGYPHEFSGGMRQRAVIAIAIANNPDLIIADEPTTALDVTVQAQILDVLATARELTGAALLLITHDLGIVAQVADRALVMRHGEVVETAEVTELFAAPKAAYTRGLLGALPRIDAHRGQRLVPIPEAVSDTEAEAAEGAEPSAVSAPLAPPKPGEVVLEVVDLLRVFPLTKGAVFKRKIGEVRAVDGISFLLRAGETLALVGESGSGKSTTLTQILELLPPQSGTISILGHNVAALDRAARAKIRRELQVVFQDPTSSLDPRMPVSDVLAEPLRVHKVPPARVAERVQELLALVGLRPQHAGRYPAEFSGGQKQRIGIARALALEPKILLLDEPVSALDVSVQAGIVNLLLDLQDRLGLAYLFVSHDLAVVRHLADRVAVMHHGKLVEYGEADQVFTAPADPYTRALLAAVPVPDPSRRPPRKGILTPINREEPLR